MLKEIGILVTREATVIDFETPQTDAEMTRALLEQFALEYDPSSVTILCPATKCSSNIAIWKAVWLHESEKPPFDFAICEYSRN